ncbi:hypothetical protein H2198_004770 [Neophaeococcomyces mojaviensis]|uniref:Uncharacterized protein n=1 Tax=Neophaeococcomyces mojaviensis TaxID=3383035 RepID=A0ACC3A814_9EURO|nr:hypothetical protein H2198_004770 [Knufia sp. JES_112]
MDALVYEDSPLAHYLEGQAIPCDIPRDPTPPPSSFAPPNFKERIQSIRKGANSIQPTSSEQILEQFRYIIVASHLLSDEAPPRPAENETRERDQSLLHGAVATAVLSFVAAWTLHWLRSRKSTLRSLTWIELSTYCLAAFCVGVALLLFSRRQYSTYVQKAAAASLTRLVNQSHAFDSTASRTLRFIQEVELVARGYDLGSTLPPISRLEDQKAIRRCQNLRSELVTTLTLLITLYVESHNVLQSYVIQQDLQQYHDIYEISLAEYSDAIKVANESTEEAKSSLKELRFALRLHAVARKAFLCDLLALRTTSGWHRVRQWRAVLAILREIEEETFSRHQSVSTKLHNEEFGWETDQRRAGRDSLSLSPNVSTPSPSESRQYKMQMRRFEDVAYSIRALNAKIHILKEEISGLTSAHTDEAVISAALSKHYEALGTDIRALQYDWERGRNAMLLSVSTNDYRSPRASSLSPRSPMSPSPSLGGFTVVDGGPAEALRLLNGDDRSSRSSDGTLYDEEVFEAVSKPLPRKRMSMSAGLTREEKIAKLNQDRRKRATMQEQADTTTSMLRELQMVIKHRPNTHARSPSTPTGSRVVSI